MMQVSTVDSAAGVRGGTGTHAPVSGWWRPMDDPKPFRYIQQGELIPGVDGNRAVWVLEYALPPSRRAHTAQPRISNLNPIAGKNTT